MLWGNVIAIALLFLQKTFHLLQLNPESYYVDVVPVNINIVHILLLNAGSIVVTTLMLVIPSYLVSKISPDKTI
jgi:lipoprotein-releasing system permease protein